MNLFSVMFVVFLVLKLTNVIDWSWWLVTLPLWSGLAFIVIAAVFAAFLSHINKRF